jgi:hypothetical protein
VLAALLALVMLGAAAAASAYTLSSPPPPSWFDDGKRVIEARGGKCVRETQQAQGGTPSGETVRWTEYSLRCRHSVPRAVAPVGFETCFAGATEGSLYGDSHGAQCLIYANPRVRATWRCDRQFYVYDRQPADNRNDPRWTTKPSAAFPKDRQSLTLRACLAPRVALGTNRQSPADARTNGIKLRVLCSHDCKVAVSGRRARLKAGKRRIFQLRGRRTSILASAGRYRGRANAVARIRAGRVKVSPETLDLR